MDPLGLKEIEILLQISRKSLSQRELAKKTSFSLGLINTSLRKLVHEGYVGVSSLNKRKVEYRLTPLGALEAARHNHRRATDTIRDYRRMTEDLIELLSGLHRSGYEYFSIHGDGELKELIEATFRSCLQAAPATLGIEHRDAPRSVILNTTPDPVELAGQVVSVIEKLGKNGERNNGGATS